MNQTLKSSHEGIWTKHLNSETKNGNFLETQKQNLPHEEVKI